MANDSENDVLDIGRWIGQGQAFGLVASKCSAAQAQCLQTIREEGHYQALDLTWDEFCRRHLGISRSYADQLIRNLQQFGSAYFRLSQILHISDAGYREIAAAVTAESIVVDGETIPLIPENAARIRKAVAQLRSELRTAQARRPAHALYNLRTRIDNCFREMGDIARGPFEPGDMEKLRELLEHIRRRLELIPLDA